ncbi:MAG TPA: crossover junction endodeoxyribonuclease RuvC [Oscillatoriaceae cyanobacterium]
MLILGIDPGTATIGYGFVNIAPDGSAEARAYGTIRTDRHLSMPERLKVLHEDITTLLRQYPPDVMAVEELFFFRNVNTAIPVAQARGVLLLAAAQAGVPVVGYTPMQIKLTIAGHGRAQKLEVQEAIRDLLDLESIPRPDDAADALSVALTHWHFLEGQGGSAAPTVEIGPWAAVLPGGADPALSQSEHEGWS